MLRETRPHRGFTLIETIMVIAIIGLLLALTVPQLGLVRRMAQRTQSLSNLRTHVHVFTTYTTDHDGTFPFFMHPNAPQTIIRGGGFALPVPVEHFFFASYTHWPVALAPYYEDTAFHQSCFPPASLTTGGGQPYLYSNNFVATPDYWRREMRLAGTSQLRPIHQHQVRHPANKGLMLDPASFGFYDDSVNWPPRTGSPILVGVVDGSARSVGRNSLTPWYHPAEEHTLDWPIVHTVGGVEAVDAP